MRHDEDRGLAFHRKFDHLTSANSLRRAVLLFQELHQHIQKKNDGQSIQDGKYHNGHLSPSGALARVIEFT
jgi:hypothetical protein